MQFGHNNLFQTGRKMEIFGRPTLHPNIPAWSVNCKYELRTVAFCHNMSSLFILPFCQQHFIETL